MGQIIGSNISATAAMFALWIGVLAILAAYPGGNGSSAEINAQQFQNSGQVEFILPS